MRKHKPSSKKMWYAKKYGLYKNKKKKKEFVYTMKPIKSGWMRYPLVARAMIWDFFYYPKPGIRKRGIEKNTPVLVFFVPDSCENYIGGGSEAIALDLNDPEALKTYVRETETRLGATISKMDMDSKRASRNHKKKKSISDSQSSSFAIKTEPEFFNEILCSSENSVTKKIWHWDTTNIAIAADQLVATIKEEREKMDDEEETYTLQVFISPFGHKLREEAFEHISTCYNNEFNSKGIITVKEQNKQFGFLNEKLEYLFPPVFDSVYDFVNGYSFAFSDSLYILSENGTQINLNEKLGRSIVRAKSFYEGIARVSIMDIDTDEIAYYVKDSFDLGCWLYINTEGNPITEPNYIIAHDMRDGLAFVCKGKWYKDPKWDNEYKKNCYWSDELLWGAIDNTGKEVVPCRFEEMAYLEHNKLLCASIYNEEIDLWGIIDRKGNWIVEPQWTYRPISLNEHLITVDKNDDNIIDDLICGVYDIVSKSIILELLYYDIELVENGTVIKAKEIEGTFSYFDLKGNRIVKEENEWKLKYDGIFSYNDGYEVKIGSGLDSLYGFVDLQGNSILPCIFPFISMDKKRLVFERKGKCGLMDFDENILMPPHYDYICINKDKYEPYYNEFPGMVEVRKGSYIGIFTIDGSMIIPPKYLEIKRIENGFCLCKTDQGYDMLKLKFCVN